MALLPDSLGDFILTTPSLQSLEKVFDPKGIHWILPDALLEASKLIQLQANRIPTSELNEAYFKRADLIFSFPPATRYHWLAKKLGGKRRIGYVHEKMWIPRIIGKFCLTDRWVCPADSKAHEVEAYGKLLEMVKIPFCPDIPSLFISESSEAEAEQLVRYVKEKKIIGIHLNSRWPKNPLPYLQSIAAPILVLTDPIFEAKAREWLAKTRLQSAIFAGSKSLSTFAALLKRLSLLIAMDGGPVHLSAAARTPSLVFYPDDQFDYRVMKWHPWNVPYQAFPLVEGTFERLPDLLQR